MPSTIQSITGQCDFSGLLKEPPTPGRLLHYYRPSAPAGSWAAVPNGDAVTVAGYPLYEVCPACQVRFSALPSDSTQGGGVR